MIMLKDIELVEDEYGYLNGKIPYNDVGVGFDVTKMNVYIYYVDWDLFDKKVEEGAISVNIAPKPEQCLFNMLGNTKYKSVNIKISDYEKLKIQKSNIPGKKDFAILEVHVIPFFELTGNINNYSCEELQNRVMQLLDILATEYGLMCENVVNINSAEININFTEYIDRDEINFDYYRWLLGPFQYYLDSNRFHSELYYIPHIEDYKSRILVPEKYPTGLRSISKTIKINIYDKSYEVMHENHNTAKKAWKKEHKHIMQLAEMTPIIRLEFGLQKIKQIKAHFGGKCNLMEMQQSDVEAAFMSLFDKYIYMSVIEYQDYMDEEMRMYFSHIDMTNRKWKMNLIKFLSKYQDKTGYLCLDLESIAEYVKLIPGKSVKTHAARIRKDLINEIDNTFKVGKTILYYNFNNVELLRNRIKENRYGPREIEFKLSPESYRMLRLLVEKTDVDKTKQKYIKQIDKNDPNGEGMKEYYAGLNISFYTGNRR